MNDPKFKIGDLIYIVDSGEIYSKIGGSNGVFEWNTKIPMYSGNTFFSEWRNFKYKIVEMRYHSKAGQYTQTEEIREYWKDKGGMNDKFSELPIYLISSINNPTYPTESCLIEIGEDGLSVLTPEQHANEQFNALMESHKGKYTVDNYPKDFPKQLIKQIYDIDDNVLFGSHYVKGKVSYNYIDGYFAKDGISFIIYTSIDYDGKGNSDLPEDAIKMHFRNLPKMFPNNKFA